MKKLLELRKQKADSVGKSLVILDDSETEKRNLTQDESEILAKLRAQINSVNQHIEHSVVVADEERSLIGVSTDNVKMDAP